MASDYEWRGTESKMIKTDTVICDQPDIDGPGCECLLDLEPVCDFECAILLNGVCFWCKTPTAKLVKLKVLAAGDLLPMGVLT